MFISGIFNFLVGWLILEENWGSLVLENKDWIY